MKNKSTIMPNKFRIEIKDKLAEITFYDDVEKIINKEDNQTIYEYRQYKIKVLNRPNLEKKVNDNLNVWLEFAKNKDYEEKAKVVREKRNKLLAETDKEVAFDRLNINLPNNLTSANLISKIKQFFEELSNIYNGEWAKYRQELRDITKQKGFPYDVEFPKAPLERIDNNV